MIKPRIIVTGATGKTGSVVVSELLKAGYPVRAMVHREDARSARLRAYGAEIAVADLSDFERVADALKDVQRAYFCPPFDPYMIQGAVAAKEARIEYIVGLTQWLASPSHPSLMSRQSWLVIPYWQGDVTQGDSWDKGPRFHHRAQLIAIEPLLGIVSTVHPEPASCPRCGNTPRFRNLEAKEAKVAAARAQKMSGDDDAARKSYEDFLILRKDADPDIPIHRQAKGEYARLLVGSQTEQSIP
jgi:NmrA-like family